MFRLSLVISLLSFPFISITADEQANIFDEVVVTARQREETAQSVPIPITALGGDQIEARNITELADIGKLTPNMNFEAQGINSTVTNVCLLYTSPSPRDVEESRMPSSA